LLQQAPELFEASGRLSVRQGERADHAHFVWQVTPQGESIVLNTPLGQGLAELRVDADGARLRRPASADLRAADLDQLAARVFGQPLPLAELRVWLRGARGASGRVDGWAVTVLPGPAPQAWPRRLDASNGEVALTLLIDDWIVP
jgi:outer membrane lipoprotein LolB